MIQWGIRVAFLGLFLFEGANYVQVLNFTLDYTWFGLLLVSLVVFLGLEGANRIFKRRWRAALHWSVWPLAFFAVSFDAFGDILHFYSRWSWYDQIGHYLGALVTCIIIFSALRAIEKTHNWQHPYHINPLLALGLTMTLASLYEIEEYLEDYFSLTNRLGDGADTANDLLMNLFGALTLVFVVTLHRCARRRVTSRN